MSAAELKFHECIWQLLSFLRWKQIQFNPQDNQSLVLFRQIRRRERLEYPYTLIEAECNFIQSLFRDENLLLTESVCHTRGHGEDYVSQVCKEDKFCLVLQGECKQCNRVILGLRHSWLAQCPWSRVGDASRVGLIESGQLRRLFRGGGGVDESVQLVKEMHTLAPNFIQGPLPKPTFCQRLWDIFSYFVASQTTLFTTPLAILMEVQKLSKVEISDQV